jgi:hypothetical protein
MFVKCAERFSAVQMSFQGWVRLKYIVGRRHVRDGRNVTVPTGTGTRHIQPRNNNA